MTSITHHPKVKDHTHDGYPLGEGIRNPIKAVYTQDGLDQR